MDIEGIFNIPSQGDYINRGEPIFSIFSCARKYDDNIAKISVIGTAMRTQTGIAKRMFEVLSEKQINMQVISTSEIKISVLIQADYTELAVRSLHDAFGLDRLD